MTPTARRHIATWPSSSGSNSGAFSWLWWWLLLMLSFSFWRCVSQSAVRYSGRIMILTVCVSTHRNCDPPPGRPPQHTHTSTHVYKENIKKLKRGKKNKKRWGPGTKKIVSFFSSSTYPVCFFIKLIYLFFKVQQKGGGIDEVLGRMRLRFFQIHQPPPLLL